MPIRRKTLEEYFGLRVRKQEGGCWLWTGMRSPSGYGRIVLSKGAKPVFAHIASWNMYKGQGDADGQKIRQSCGNRSCVNPDHLFISETTERFKGHRFDLTQDELKSDLDYNETTGIFTWKVIHPGIHVGDQAGRVDHRGYRRITIRYHAYLAHRLAWFYVYGEWPRKQIDHKDCDPDNNAIDNLRVATQSQNRCNQVLSKRNTSGFKGVCKTSDGRRWRAAIGVGRQWHHIGNFDTAEKAHQAYCEAAKAKHGEFARSG